MSTQPQVSHRLTGRARTMAYVADALTACIAAAYFALSVLVRDIESVINGSTMIDPGYGSFYRNVAIVCLAAAILLVLLPRRSVWVGVAAFQIAIVGMFIFFGVPLVGRGVFSPDALAHLPVGLLVTIVTVAQAVLSGLLIFLAVRARPGAADQDGVVTSRSPMGWMRRHPVITAWAFIGLAYGSVPLWGYVLGGIPGGPSNLLFMAQWFLVGLVAVPAVVFAARAWHRNRVAALVPLVAVAPAILVGVAGLWGVLFYS